MMNRIHTKSFSRIILAVIMAGGLAPLAGCNTPPKAWSESNVDKRNKVELTKLTQDLEFTNAGKALTPASHKALEAFLKDSNIGQYDELTVDMPVGADGQVDATYLRRRATLAAYLANLGLKLGPNITPYGAALPPGSVRLVVSRYVVTPPACPDWSKPAGPDYQNTASSNFGCATTSALGQMIANPHDLIEGRPYSGADATVAAKAVQNYHENKVEDPTVTSGSSGSSASGSGGN